MWKIALIVSNYNKLASDKFSKVKIRNDGKKYKPFVIVTESVIEFK